MNYAALVVAISDYTENTFQTVDVNLFITQAEQRIYNSVQFPSLRKNVTGTVTANNKYLSCPEDFLSAYSLAIFSGSGPYTFLLNKDVNFMREAYPTPDATYSVELHYNYYPESITTASSGQTWLGDNFDTVLLYGSLVEAYTYMKGEQDMMALYNQKYMEAIVLAKRLGDGLERSDAYRSGQYRALPLPQNTGIK